MNEALIIEITTIWGMAGLGIWAFLGLVGIRSMINAVHRYVHGLQIKQWDTEKQFIVIVCMLFVGAFFYAQKAVDSAAAMSAWFIGLGTTFVGAYIAIAVSRNSKE